MEKSEKTSKNENREIIKALINSFWLKLEKLLKLNKKIDQTKQELGLKGD